MSFSRREFLAVASALAAQAKTLVIDAHCHAGRGQAMSAPWSTRADVEVTLRHMAEAGIDRTVIFPINNTDYEKPNQEIAEICDRHPGKFIGFAKHDPQTEPGLIGPRLRREVESLGLKGLKLHRLPTRELLDTVAELGIPVLYHPEKVANFHMIAAEYPQIPFLMAHLGNFASRDWPEHMEAISVARRYPNVYLETSSGVLQVPGDGRKGTGRRQVDLRQRRAGVGFPRRAAQNPAAQAPADGRSQGAGRQHPAPSPQGRCLNPKKNPPRLETSLRRPMVRFEEPVPLAP